MSDNRDEFSAKTKRQIGARAGWLCSNPGCRAMTVGATRDGEGEMNLGTAAHICAASPRGPRYDASMSREDRISAANGIWLCRDDGTAIDADAKHFTVEMLRGWKRLAEEESWRRVFRNEPPPLVATSDISGIRHRFHGAADTDLAAFQRKTTWPRTRIQLTLKVDGFEESATAQTLATAVRLLDDLILAAPPGMGKTVARKSPRQSPTIRVLDPTARRTARAPRQEPRTGSAQILARAAQARLPR